MSRSRLRYRLHDVFHIPVTDDVVALGHVAQTLRHGNLLIAVFPERSQTPGADLPRVLSVSRPAFVVETMDQRLRDGTWPVVGSWVPIDALPMPVYKIQIGFGGDYFEQRIDGTIGRRLTQEEAAGLRRPRSYSPALVEEAVRAYGGLAPWLPTFDEMRSAETM